MKKFLGTYKWLVWPVLQGFLVFSITSVIPKVTFADVHTNINNNITQSKVELTQEKIRMKNKNHSKPHFQIAKNIASQIKSEYSRNELKQMSKEELRQLVIRHPLLLDIQSFSANIITQIIIETVLLILIVYIGPKIIEAIRDSLHYCDYLLNSEEFLVLAEIEDFNSDIYQKKISVLSYIELKSELDLIRYWKGIYYRNHIKGCDKCVKVAMDNIATKEDQIEVELYNSEPVD